MLLQKKKENMAFRCPQCDAWEFLYPRVIPAHMPAGTINFYTGSGPPEAALRYNGYVECDFCQYKFLTDEKRFKLLLRLHALPFEDYRWD